MPDMLSGFKTGNGIPHDRYNIRGIAHVRTKRKDDIFMQRRLGQICICILEWGKIQTVTGPSLHNLSCACYHFWRTHRQTDRRTDRPRY